MLFEDACARYLEAKRPRLRATTMEGYESAIRRHLLPRWAGTELEEISPEDIQGWVDGFELAGAAEKAYKTLRQVVRWSIRRLRVRMWDPTTAEIELPRKRPYRPDVLDAREERRMLRGIYGAPFEAVVLCAAVLGLRRCEACALEWGDVDYRTGEVHVSRGVHTVRGGEVTTPTKTDKGDRVLVLPRFALMRLRKLSAGRRRGRMCPLRPDQVAARARTWCRRLHLPWVGMKNLRHSFATIAVASGTSLEDIMLWLGHSSYDTSYAHYIVRTPSICRRVSKAYEGALMAA